MGLLYPGAGPDSPWVDQGYCDWCDEYRELRETNYEEYQCEDCARQGVAYVVDGMDDGWAWDCSPSQNPTRADRASVKDKVA